MDIALERKFFSTFKQINSAEKICEVSAEIVVPDTKEDILRMLLTDAKYKIRAKDVEQGKVSIQGELEVNAAYVPETAEGLNILRADIPFECVLESENVEIGCVSIADIKLIMLETRILNPRKILINAQLLITARCYCISDFEWYEEPAESEKNVFFRTENETASFTNIVTEKTFSLEDDFQDIELSENAEIITGKTEFFTDSADAVGSKLIMKGHAAVSVLYIYGGKLEKAEKTVSYSQIFEMSERDTVPEYYASILPTGDYFEITDGRISFEIHAVMQLVCKDKKTISYVSDGYVCNASAELNAKNVSLTTSERKIEIRDAIQMVYTSEQDVSGIEAVTARIGKLKTAGTEINLPVCSETVYKTKDEQLRPCKTHGNAKLDLAMEAGEEIDRICAEISSVTANYNGKEISVNVSLLLKISLIYSNSYCMVSGASFEAPENVGNMPSAYMCRAESNDLWCVAKKYSSDRRLIAQLNAIEEGTDIRNKLLLIPRVR